MRKILSLALVTLALNASCLNAQTVGEIDDPPTVEDLALDAASQVAMSGPRDIILRDQAVLHLKSGFKFIPRLEANGLLAAWGNTYNDQLVGLVLPISEDENWTLLIEQVKEGHVSDDEAKSWNPDDLLSEIKQGAEVDNKDRIARGFPAVEVLGWKQVPKYDATDHKLLWALQSQDKGATAAQDASINYNTYALGRDGYFKFNLVTDVANFDRDEAIGQHMLADFVYNPGKTYSDFQATSDKAADYSIATLVSGASPQPQTSTDAAFDFWDFIQGNAKYFALACALAAGAIFFSGRRK